MFLWVKPSIFWYDRQAIGSSSATVAATPKDEIIRNESNHMVMRVAGISRHSLSDSAGLPQ